MEQPQLAYLVRDQDEERVTLDLLQAWGPPLRQALRMRVTAGVLKFAQWLRGRRDRKQSGCHARPPHGSPQQSRASEGTGCSEGAHASCGR